MNKNKSILPGALLLLSYIPCPDHSVQFVADILSRH